MTFLLAETVTEPAAAADMEKETMMEDPALLGRNIYSMSKVSVLPEEAVAVVAIPLDIIQKM